MSASQNDPISKEEIETFLRRETLGYQHIQLPFGLSTPGEPRQQAKEVAFAGGVEGKTVLDIGSYLGAFCIEALRRGAARAVGLELDRERIRQARQIARFTGLEPEYLRADIEERPLQEQFDRVLCLNVLHHMRDAIGALRYIARNTRECLVIEAATLGAHDSEKLGLNVSVTPPSPKQRLAKLLTRIRGDAPQPSVAQLLNEQPLAYIGPYSPKSLAQSFFFTASGLRRILDGHMRLFQRVEMIESEFKGRYLLQCTRLKIDRMIVVAGANGSGKSTLCEKIKQKEFNDVLGGEMSEAHLVAPSWLWDGPTERKFSRPHYPLVLLHYDISSVIDRYRMHSFARDPAVDLLQNSAALDFVIVAPSREVLLQQAQEPEPSGRPKDKFHRKCVTLYARRGYLTGLYKDWINFCGTFKGRFFVYTEKDDARRLIPYRHASEVLDFIEELYGAETPYDISQIAP